MISPTGEYVVILPELTQPMNVYLFVVETVNLVEPTNPPTLKPLAVMSTSFVQFSKVKLPCALPTNAPM